MSPIRGLTDNSIPQWPYLGKLRKGGARPESGKAPGKELSYWRFTSDNPKVVGDFAKAYGEEPQELAIYLPFARVEDCFPTWRELWVAGGLKHRCDGETCAIWLTEEGTYSREPTPCPGGCKQVGRLSVILPELLRAGHMGLVTMETHSVNDILSIHRTLVAVLQANPDRTLTGVGFFLRRVQREISTPAEDGKRVRRKKWMVVLQPVAAWVLAQIEAADPLLQIEGGDEDDVVVDEQTGEILDQEAKPQAPVARTRPYEPDCLRDKLAAKLASDKTLVAERSLQGAVCGALDNLFMFRNDDRVHATEKRHSLLGFFFGSDTTKTLTQAQASAMLNWAQDQNEDGEYVPNPQAVEEAARIIRQVLADAGQADMFGKDADEEQA